MASPLLLLLLLLPPLPPTTGATWCVCRSDVSDTSLQKTLDYACGALADCNPILQNGVCFQPDTVGAHCSYAANSFFQRKGQEPGSCDFDGTATLITIDPSYGSCSYPSTGSSAAITTTTTAPDSSTPTGFRNGGLGGIGNGLTTDGTTMAGGVLLKAWRGTLPTSLVLAGTVLMRELF